MCKKYSRYSTHYWGISLLGKALLAHILLSVHLLQNKQADEHTADLEMSIKDSPKENIRILPIFLSKY